MRSLTSVLPWMHAALDSAADGILIEAGERVVYANASYAALLGYRRPAELLARSVTELVAEPDVDRLARFGRMRVAGEHVPATYDFVALRSDASAVRLQASVSITICSGTPYITTIVRLFPGSAADSPEAAIAGPHDQLSPRERQVMEMMLAGKRAKVIALELELTENTVATHRVRLLEKIGVSDNRELFQYALRHRLIDWS
jgi:PAS domain S-box-containing protein